MIWRKEGGGEGRGRKMESVEGEIYDEGEEGRGN
jgi:hypothetical protein